MANNYVYHISVTSKTFFDLTALFCVRNTTSEVLADIFLWYFPPFAIISAIQYYYCTYKIMIIDFHYLSEQENIVSGDSPFDSCVHRITFYT